MKLKMFILAGLCGLSAVAQTASPLKCTATAVPVLLRTEGLAERVGDIVLNCTDGTPGGSVSANLTAFTNTAVTNKVSSTGTVDAALTVDVGAGQVSAGATAVLNGSSSIIFQGVNFTLPARGAATLRITNLRVNATNAQITPIQVQLATNGPSAITVSNNNLQVGLGQRGLLASYASTFVCTVSPVPSTLTFSAFLSSGTRFASLRVTEGLPSAFALKETPSDNGTRVAVRYSGFPAGSRVFVPDVIAGSNALQPTAAGDLGGTVSTGAYTAGTLTLVRVLGTDARGAGGNLLTSPVFGNVSEVALSGGAGIAVYEITDSNAAVRESAQIPTWLGLETRPEGGSIQAKVDVSFAPISDVAVASSSAPVPRFAAVTPQADCSAVGDCGASYFPALNVTTQPLQFTAIAGSGFQIKYISVQNGGGSLLNWTAAVTYPAGSPTGWIRIDPDYGFNNATIRLDVLPEKFSSAGTFTATLTIDAGPIAGAKTLPVTLVVTAPPQLPRPVISSVVNAASFAAGPLVPGSFGTIIGTGFKSSKLDVMFNGIAAKVVFSNDTQINLLVPSTLVAPSSAQMIVTVDGVSSTAVPVQLAQSAPAIFSGAVLNQDWTPNMATNPAIAGSVLQLFLTGLATNGVSVRMGTREITSLAYAGEAPAIPGLQQVNVVVPADTAAGTVELRVCSLGACSPAVNVTVRQ